MTWAQAFRVMEVATEGRRFLSSSADHNATDDDAHDSHGDHHVTEFGIGVFVLALALGIISRRVLVHYPQLPYTVVVLILGLAMGLPKAPATKVWGEELGTSLDAWETIDPHVVLTAMLPILIFESAFSTDVHIFLHELPQILALAVPGVMFSTMLTALIARVFPYGWTWDICLMFGAMMSATDPVAVVALLKELGVSARLGTLIEGESLLNDGTSIVVFGVALNSVKARAGVHGIDEVTAGGAIANFLQLAAGGPCVGLIIGWFVTVLISYVVNDLQSEISLTIVACYSCWIIAESPSLMVSGVLAVVTCGLYLSFYGREQVSPSVEHSMHAFWEMLGWIANTLIFFVSGLIMAEAITSDDGVDGRDFGYLIFLYIGIHVVRLINVACCWPILRKGYGLKISEGVVLTYGGLRGAVGLCLALILDGLDDYVLKPKDKERLNFHMAGIALMTLLINGTTMRPLLQYLGMSGVKTRAETDMFEHANLVIEHKLQHFVETVLKPHRFFGDADFQIVWRYIPCLTHDVYIERLIEEQHICLYTEELQHVDQDIVDHLPEPIKRDLPSSLRSVWASYHKTYSPEGHERTRTQSQMVLSPNTRGEISVFGSESSLALRSSLSEDGGRVSATERDSPTDGSPPPSPSLGGSAAPRPPSPASQLGTSGSRHSLGLAASASTYSTLDTMDSAKMWDQVRELKRKHKKTLTKLEALEVKMAETKIQLREDHENAVAAEMRIQQQTDEAKLKMDMASTTSASGGASTSLGHKAGLGPSVDGKGQEETKTNGASKDRGGQNVSVDSKERKANIEHGRGTPVMKGRTLMSSQLDVLTHKGSLSNTKGSTGSTKYFSGIMFKGSSGSLSMNQEPELPEDLKKDLAEARTRLISAIKAEYQANFNAGRMSPTALHILRESADRQLDNPEKELHDWAYLTPRLEMPWFLSAVAKRCLRFTLIEQLSMSFIYKHLALIMEIASEFVEAHESVEIDELLDEKSQVSNLLDMENLTQLQQVKETLKKTLPSFPEVARSLKTQIASRLLLVRHKELVEILHEHGTINDTEEEQMAHANAELRACLNRHPLSEQIPKKEKFLEGAPFLKGMPEKEFQNFIITSNHYCNEEFHGSNVTLMKQGENCVAFGPSAGHRGFFYIVRGHVHRVCKVDPDDPALELLEGVTSPDALVQDILGPGQTIGMQEAMLNIGYQGEYITSSFCHLCFFDSGHLVKDAMTRCPVLRLNLIHAMGRKLLPKYSKVLKSSQDALVKIVEEAEVLMIKDTRELEAEDAKALSSSDLAAASRKMQSRRMSITVTQGHMDEGRVDQVPMEIKRRERSGSFEMVANNIGRARRRMSERLSGRPELTKHRSKACLKADMTVDVLTYVEEVIHVRGEESLLLLEGSIVPAEKSVREEEKKSKRRLGGGDSAKFTAAGAAATTPGRSRRPSISEGVKTFRQSVRGIGRVAMTPTRAGRTNSAGSDLDSKDDEANTKPIETGDGEEDTDTVPPLSTAKGPSSHMLGSMKPLNRTESFRRHGGTLLRVPSMFFMKALENQLKLHRITEERYHEALELAFQVDENDNGDGTEEGELKAPLLIHGNDEDISFSPGSIVLRFKLGDEVYDLNANHTKFGSRITGGGGARKAAAKDKVQDHLDARGAGKDMDSMMSDSGSFKRKAGHASPPKRSQRRSMQAIQDVEGMAENVSDAETYESDESDEEAGWKVGDLVVIVKEEVKDGKVVKSTVYGETATVIDADWNGMCKVKLKTGNQMGATKSYKPEFLKKEGEEAEAYLNERKEKEKEEGEGKGRQQEEEGPLPPPPQASPSMVPPSPGGAK